jgi:adenylate cyclase
VATVNVDEPKRFRLTYLLQGVAKSVEFSQAEVLIGRSPECDLVLNQPGMSRKHALIRRTADGWLIVDQGSRNGIYVNQHRVAHQILRSGDRITPGPEALTPVAITFSELSAADSPQSLVAFKAAAGAANVSMSLNVAEFERTLALAPADRKIPPSAADLPWGPRPLIGMFKEVSEVLLACRTLDEILEKVISLVLEHLPVERGAICLCDPAAETITPKTVRAKGLVGGEPITISRSIAQATIHAKQSLLVTDAPSDDRFAQAQSVRDMNIRAAMCAPLYHAGQVQGLIYVDTSEPVNRLGAHDLELLTALGGLTAVGIEQVRLREDIDRERAIRGRLARYSSPGVVEQIIARAGTTDGEMISEQRQVSVLFADLSDFTPMAESMEPAEVARLLNGAFELLTDAVFAFDGTLDKYMGDAVMAIFGAPLTQPNHAERAVRAALRMQQFLVVFNRLRPPDKPLRMRIGINSGAAVAGDIGSPIRKDYTVVGDVVNVASRLESSVAEAGQIVIGPATYELVKTAFTCQQLPEHHLKGKQQVIRPYLVLGAVDEPATGDESTECGARGG